MISCSQTVSCRPAGDRRAMVRSLFCLFVAFTGSVAGLGFRSAVAADVLPAHRKLADQFQSEIRPLLVRLCEECHSADVAEAEINLQAFSTFQEVQKGAKTWQKISEMVRSGQMPPADSTRPTEQERQQIEAWIHGFLREEALRRKGDPGQVLLRRLTNAEYTYTLRDLTGLVDLNPAEEFPVDGAAGEGFSNTGAALVMSPALLTKYLDAAKRVGEHVVLLPDGFRFSEFTTRRDQTNELLGRIRQFYARFVGSGQGEKVNLQGIVFETNGGGRLPVEKYLLATLLERDALQNGTLTIRQLAEREGLSPKYLQTLWDALHQENSTFLIRQLADQWKSATADQLPQMVGGISAWQKVAWKFSTVGHIGKVGGPVRWMEPVSLDVIQASYPSPPPESIRDQPEAVQQAIDDFRQLFPPALCYTQIVPVDEVVTYILYFREDDHLSRLMLDERQQQELDRLWEELRYVSREALVQVDVYLQLMEYLSQDADPSLFEPLRKPVHERAEAFQVELREAEPHHLRQLLDFAASAYRRPLLDKEQDNLHALYQKQRSEGLSHEEAFGSTFARILIAPEFLYRLEQPGPGQQPTLISNRELINRLSYFLWSSLPDQELHQLAESGQIRDPDILRQQIRRMLKDERIRRLATEFACQWTQIYDFDQLDEKSEEHFPTFVGLRGEMYEESIRFFQDFFRENRSVADLLDADFTYLNGPLAEHYQIPGVTGENWRRVDGIKSYGRGGILGQASMLSKHSGASRTSPTLRGTWISDVLLGEKLPKPPKDVPLLPEDPDAFVGLTVRQLVEKHANDPRCAVCHVKVDPMGFALEAFDSIGRLRERDHGDLAFNLSVTAPEGTEFSGMEGLRDYLLTIRREPFLRQFSRKLLGYAVGRSADLSDEFLLDDMQAAASTPDGRIEDLIEMIVLSPQFQQIRGRDFSDDE